MNRTTQTSSNKGTRITYWVLTTLFCLFMIMDAIGGLTQQEDGIKAMIMLGYPIYILPLIGTFKLLGVIAILQTRFKLISEWAYAGFTFNFVMASLSWAAVNGPAFFILFPIIVLAIMLLAYYLRKKQVLPN